MYCENLEDIILIRNEKSQQIQSRRKREAATNTMTEEYQNSGQRLDINRRRRKNIIIDIITQQL